MILPLIFTVFSFAQSFPEKPDVPVFHVNGERIVRVDCWGIEKGFKTIYLKETTHPEVFKSQLSFENLSIMEIEVSRLESEDTLRINVAPMKTESLEVKTYGTNCGFALKSHNVYCSIFDGEILEN